MHHIMCLAMMDDNTTRPETVPEIELKAFSGPYSRELELICEIADQATLNVCSNILSAFGIIPRKVSAHYHETKFYLAPEGDDSPPGPGTRFYTAAELRQVCDALKRGELPPISELH